MWNSDLLLIYTSFSSHHEIYVFKIYGLSPLIFSSPELKAQVSFSDHLSSIVCPSVRHLSLNFSHFLLLLQNHWANFNQTWHKASLGRGDSSLFRWRVKPFSKGRLLRNSENTLTKLKNLLLQNHWANFNQNWQKASLGEGDSSLFK